MKIKSIIAISLMTIFLLVVNQKIDEVEYLLPHMMIINVFPIISFHLIHIEKVIIRPQRFMNLTKADFVKISYWLASIFVVYRLSNLIGEQALETIIKDSTFRVSVWILFVVHVVSNYEKSKETRMKIST